MHGFFPKIVTNLYQKGTHENQYIPLPVSEQLLPLAFPAHLHPSLQEDDKKTN